ncbi:MAG TPA: hypothetical protein VFH43_11575 [Candidatus Kapabacteria bacterium]|nr:hypothetical protein [Candidatus Kapabacteria bacterium]
MQPTNPYGKISTEAVKAKTGRDWEEWLAVLDKEKAEKLDHKDIAELLVKKHEVTPWWAQMLTVGYERARGLREVHETKQGFVASVSKTINVSRDLAWKMLMDPDKWFTLETSDVRGSEPKSVRFKVADGSRVELMLLNKGPRKCSVTAQQSRLTGQEQVAAQKIFWNNALDRLKQLLESSAE